MKWNEYFFSIVDAVKQKSKDPSSKFGCVIVGPDNELRSTGYNSFPRGLNDNVPARSIRPEKYIWFEHAERNAIYNAAMMGNPLKGCRIFVDGLPCVDCARAIIQSGISKLIYDKAKWDEYLEQEKINKAGQPNTTWSAYIQKSLKMLKECGVEVEAYKRGQENVRHRNTKTTRKNLRSKRSYSQSKRRRSTI